MAKEIKQRITLEGEKEYNQAIREAQRNLKTLKSELKAETAELGKNATEQQKNEAKVKSLKKQIAEQEKVVKTLREALAAAKDEYGDNADVVQKWEQKLNDARTTLANMRNDLNGVGTGLKGMGNDAAATTVATKSVADALGNIASVGDSAAGAIESIFTGMLDVITSAVSEVWNLISETAAKANNWTDLADLYGASTTEIQKMQSAIKATQGDFGKFTALMNQLSFDSSKNKKIAEWFGISDANYKNNLEYTIAVLNKMQESYKEWGTGGKWDNAMADIFGAKKSADVVWFVTNWEKIMENAEDLEGKNYLVSEEDTKTLNDVWLLLGKIQEKWEKIKDKIGGGFGTVTLDILAHAEGALDGIAEYLNAEDDEAKQAALDKVRENIEELFRKVADLIRDCAGILRGVGEDLSKSDDPLTSAIGDILVRLSDALQWMVDNSDKVRIAFDAIFGAWLLFKLAAIAGKLSSIVTSIEAVKAFKGISFAAGAAQAGTSAGASWGAAFGAAVLKAAPFLAGLGLFAENAFTAQGNDDILDENGELRPEAEELGFSLDDNGEIVKPDNGPDENGWYYLPQAKEPEEVVEEEDLDEETFTPQQQMEAVQDWWDAWRNAANEEDTWDEEQRAYDYMTEALGDSAGEVVEAVLKHLDEVEDQNKLEDIPEDWIVNAANWDNTGSADALKGLPGQIQAAVRKGAATGVAGISVTLDGRKVGQLVAPYVSEFIADDMEG